MFKESSQFPNSTFLLRRSVPESSVLHNFMFDPLIRPIDTLQRKIEVTFSKNYYKKVKASPLQAMKD